MDAIGTPTKLVREPSLELGTFRFRAGCATSCAIPEWFPLMDSNHDSEIQSLASYP
jgi:hypothetical protein